MAVESQLGAEEAPHLVLIWEHAVLTTQSFRSRGESCVKTAAAEVRVSMLQTQGLLHELAALALVAPGLLLVQYAEREQCFHVEHGASRQEVSAG